MSKNRQMYMLTNSRYIKITGTRCAYCGIIADTEDHVLPISVMYDLVNIGQNDLISFIVPACRECNSFAGARIFGTFNEKREFLRKELQKKYKSILICNWTIDDILWEGMDEVELKLKDMREKQKIEARLLHNHAYNLPSKFCMNKASKEETKEKYIYKRAGEFYVSITKDNIVLFSQTGFTKFNSAIKVRDDALLSMRKNEQPTGPPVSQQAEQIECNK